MKRKVVKIILFTESSGVLKRSNNKLYEKRLGASYGTKVRFRDGTPGSPVIEIGYKHTCRT